MLELPSPGASHCVKRPPTPSLLPGLCPSCFLIIVLDPCWSLFAFLILILVHVPDLFFCCCFFPRSPPALQMWSDQHLPRLTLPAFTTLLLDYTSLQLHNNHLPAPRNLIRHACFASSVLCCAVLSALHCVVPRIGHGWFAQERMPVVTSLAGHAASPMGPSHPLHPLLCAKSFYPYQASPFLLSGKSFNLLWSSPTTLPPFNFHFNFCFFLAP